MNLKENMKRFNTKNLNEQDPIATDNPKLAKIVAKVNQNMATMRSDAKSVDQYMGDTSSRTKVTPGELMKLMPTGQPALIMTSKETPEYLLVIVNNNLYELV